MFDDHIKTLSKDLVSGNLKNTFSAWNWPLSKSVAPHHRPPPFLIIVRSTAKKKGKKIYPNFCFDTVHNQAEYYKKFLGRFSAVCIIREDGC